MRGRKPKAESQGAQIRTSLAEWKRTPKFARASLRALSRELGTSHQLLGHYIKQWDEWQSKEYWRLAKEIRARANAESRVLTQQEEQQVYAYNRAALRVTAGFVLLDVIERIKRDSERRPLVWQEIKSLKILARHFPEARDLLLKTPQDGLKKRKRFGELVRETPRQEGETFTAWVRRIWDRCAEYGTECPAVITEELFQRCSQGSTKNQENNLPVIPAGAAKSFG
jgi:hypothetical protein